MTVGDFGHCCTSCQLYWTCETKWYRGENKEEDACCPTCNYYNECQIRSKIKKRQKSRV